MIRHTIVFVLAATCLTLAVRGGAEGFAGGVGDALGPDFAASPQVRRVDAAHAAPFGNTTERRIRYWNQVAIDASGLDHTPVAAGENRVFGEQLGPGRASRAMAIVHIAMFDAMVAVMGGYDSYTGVAAAPGASLDAAIAQAAHDTLVTLFSSQRTAIDALLAADLLAARSTGGHARDDGIDLGRRIAAAILALRADDGSQYVEPRLGTDFNTGDEPGTWRQDPIGRSPLALGAQWGDVLPFVLQAGDQFRAPPPPAMTSTRYTQAFAEVKRVGGDGVVTPTERTAEQTLIGLYWAYDGTPSLCAPPRLYNQIVTTIADRAHLHAIELARLLALVNTAMADAATAIWDSKYAYQFWRPVTGIREASAGTGPTGLGDDNDATDADPTFTPMGAPASNLTGPNFTPPFPAYPSGHAGFGGAVFQTLRHFFGTDAIAFSFVSDELNGVTLDHAGNVRPFVPRSFNSLSQAEEENGQSRIYLGIHWEFDKTEGIVLGRRVADYVWANAFAPVDRPLVRAR